MEEILNGKVQESRRVNSFKRECKNRKKTTESESEIVTHSQKSVNKRSFREGNESSKQEKKGSHRNIKIVFLLDFRDIETKPRMQEKEPALIRVNKGRS